jgi:hypothetical protein
VGGTRYEEGQLDFNCKCDIIILLERMIK